MRFRSLRTLTGAFLLAFLVATLGTGFAIYAVTLRTIERLVDRRLENVNDSVAGIPGDRRAADIFRRVDAATHERDTGDIGFVLLDAEGHRLGGNIGLSRPLPMGFSTLAGDRLIPGLSAGRALVRDVGGGMTLTTIAETEPFDDYNGARVRIYLIGFGSILFVVLGGLIVFVVTIGRRIGETRHTVEAIIDGDMTRRVPVDRSGGEFAQQAMAFNRMLDRISDLMASISNVSNDIAHDLRTPLARLRSQLALSLRRAESPVQRDDLEAAIAMSDDLLAMFAAMLRIAEIEGGDRRAGFARLDLAALADEIGVMMQPVVADSGRMLALATASPLPIVGDGQLLGQLIVNLIENTVRHTPVGTRICIAVTDTLTITDDGPGIPADQRALAMRRFGRLDTSRHDGGHGLGLPLVEAIVRLHRGTIALEDAAPGLRVVIAVPA
ncbi:histidine kinase [Sphingomonas sp. Leaf34]|uniref:sensor histidine kinase n=1 Tax=Sphingomonas sp. Leaf34 TaxID=1736216 RepID=UPI0006F73FD3|nr:ATP-binding protein [Sphingomonas sp. Leaf34]KQN27097.1 histidine kinase [Sphingomonas sp. Leaf34]